ncbi:prolyl hydroxylase EGLN3-like isoform X2 [Acropora palmata]|uniref:prolyl hydroxylase EGLN3-like isoform X2 n=1 Tax=Acropora palmata TaxID=6131 RepID=UPI003DA0BE4B
MPRHRSVKRNNMNNFISWAFASRKRSLVLRPVSLSFEERKQYITRLLQHHRGKQIYNDGLLRMSSINRTENTMRCDLCSERAFITCTRCKIARYCCPDHRKEDWKFHQRRCQGRTEQRSSGQESYPNGSRVNGEIVSTDSFQNDVSEQAIRVVATLRKQGYCYIDDFHGETTAKNILNEVKNLHQRQKFTDGELVSSNGNGSTLNKKIRDDKIAWVDGREKHCETISYHMNVVNSLIRKCNEFVEEYEIEHRTKAMVACYPGQGTGYKRHVDNPSQDGRCITTLYYLNPEWTEEKGGILKLYPGGGEKAVRILPILDRLLLFWSDRRNPHEVEPSHDIRYAITLWYFDKNERALFKEKQEALRMKELNMKMNPKVNGLQDGNRKDESGKAE